MYYRYWMHMAHRHANPAHFGLRTKRYKLIFFYGCDVFPEGRAGWGSRSEWRTPPGWELYDLEEDPKESRNRYDEHPEVVARLTALLQRYRKTGRSAPR